MIVLVNVSVSLTLSQVHGPFTLHWNQSTVLYNRFTFVLRIYKHVCIHSGGNIYVILHPIQCNNNEYNNNNNIVIIVIIMAVVLLFAFIFNIAGFLLLFVYYRKQCQPMHA